MVYIINAQDCASGWDNTATAINRNRLFTAITRSKAWVRILGIGSNMDTLIQEWDILRQNSYKLKFKYPTDEEKKLLPVINKELDNKRTNRRQKLKANREQLLLAVERGEIDAAQLILELQSLKSSRK